MKALALQLRASKLPVIGLILGAASLAMFLLRPRYWVGIWPETGAAGQVPAFFIAIFGAGLAAWVSGSLARNGLTEQLAASSRPRRSAEALRLASVAVTLLLPYGLVQATGFVVTARTFPAGVGLWMAYAGMGAAAISLAVVWGWGVGKYVSSTYAATAAVVTWFAFAAFVGDGASLNVLSGPAWQAPDLSSLALRFVAAFVVGFAVVAAPPARSEWQRPRRWLAPVRLAMPVGALASIVAVVASTAGVADRDAPSRAVCTRGEAQFCLWPENAKYVAMVEQTMARTAELPPGFAVPARVKEYGLERTRYDVGGESFTQLEGIDISEGNRSALALGLSDVIMERTVSSCDLDGIRADPAPEALRRWMELFLSERTSPDYSTSGVPENLLQSWSVAARIVQELPVEDQQAWAREELDRVRRDHCS